jgi:thiol-disulfide isomerase/thioredoxin
MRCFGLLLVLACAAAPALSQDAEGPSNEKARKTYQQALDYLHHNWRDAALGSFKKADKQDGGHCLACQRKIIKYAIEQADWKSAESAANEMVAEAQDNNAQARAHYELGVIFANEAIARHKDEYYSRLHDEMTKALAAVPGFPQAMFADGTALAHMKQDDAAKAQFANFVKLAKDDDPEKQRALRFISDPELARARMAPPFAVTTLDGQHVSLDDLQGKVVLLDFWATWCEPCREALPHMRDIAKKFEGQPLVLLSVSLDSDEQKWKDFIAKNKMTWLNYRDGGFTGPVARLFDVNAIPHTFTIDTDGVLQDEHIGDGSIEGKLKKLIARARELPSNQPAAN